MHVYLHAGVHKTGTSAIQSVLTKNRLALRERGVWYEPDKGHENHTPMVQRFQRQNPSAGSFVRDYIEAAQSTGLTKCIISSECFCEPPLPMQKIAESLAEVETTVIAYIRRPDEMMLAAHNELVKNPSSKWTTTLAERAPYDPRYWDVLKAWMDWSLVLAPYDAKQWPAGNIIADFLSMVGVDFEGLDLTGVANRSLPPALIEVLRIANRAFTSSGEREKFVLGLFDAWDQNPEMYSHGSLISEDQREIYRAQLKSVMPRYEAKLRPGFDTTFLF